MKVCTKCQQSKPLSSFYYNYKGHFWESACKECRKKRSRERNLRIKNGDWKPKKKQQISDESDHVSTDLHKDKERGLWAEVILQAQHDNDIEWFQSDNPYFPSFLGICEVLEVNPQIIREQVINETA